VDRTLFEQLVEEAIAALPREFASKVDNVVIVVEDLPSADQLSRMGIEDPHTLLGLYEGIALTDRPLAYDGALPDKITLFRVPIEEMCRSDKEVREQVRRTLIHELGHYFGMDEGRLRRIEKE
jgi:predicted Zn-dependent protease with MMP-like domain